MNYEAMLAGTHFQVALAGPGAVLAGGFTSVSGLGMEADYEVYSEGGSSYPRYFFKNIKPRRLVLGQGIVTSVDGMSALMMMVNLGMSIPMTGAVILQDSFGAPVREWTVTGAHLIRYEGPQLNSNQVELAVNRIEFMYNGCV